MADQEGNLLARVIENNTDIEIIQAWTNIWSNTISPHDHTGRPIVWNLDVRAVTDSTGSLRSCWTVNRTKYGYGLRGTGGIRVYQLAFLAHQLQERAGDPAALQQFYNNINAQDLKITHTCGNGCANNKPDVEVCCNPYHLEHRDEAYNRSQTHCHHFLNMSPADRATFFASGLCRHHPPCF